MRSPSVESGSPALPPVPSFDTRAFRTVLGQYATGVTVVTTQDSAGRAVGLTVNSFGALSLEPPLVVWSLRVVSSLVPAFDANPAFAVNILSEQQGHVSKLFASSSAEKFALTRHSVNAKGFISLEGVSACLECTTVSRQVTGDHILYIARVVGFTQSAKPPLVFHDGDYYQLGRLID
jgi:flavin reductase (DIM6/NTAB) family NADH-FMN oxidoreductase RutF